MVINLSPELERFVGELVRNGSYHTEQAVIEAGLLSLRQRQLLGDFEPGELDRLLADADADLQRNEVTDGDEFFTDLDASLARRTKHPQ